MKVQKLNESGYKEAMLGLSLSYNKSVNKMIPVSLKLSDKDGGHNKFLESIMTWWEIQAPRYWWSEFDTYRHATKQSESTMHTLKSRPLVQTDFEKPINPAQLEFINSMISNDAGLEDLKNELPEGFLQIREVCLNYKSIRNILMQRYNHKLKYTWPVFCKKVLKQVEHPELLPELKLE